MSYNREIMKKLQVSREDRRSEPQVYSIVLNVNKSGVFLYTGVHSTLDEATEAARIEAAETVPLKKGEVLESEVDLWTTYDGKRALKELSGNDIKVKTVKGTPSPVFYSIKDCRVRIENARNFIMRSILDGKDGSKLEEVKDLLTPHQMRYVKGKTKLKG